MRVKADRYCFACGPDNPKGLHLRFRPEGDEQVADFLVNRECQGWAGIAHGGILATLLDEAMTTVLYAQGIVATTAALEVRYRRPVPVGRTVQVRGRIVRRRGRLAETAANITLDDGSVAAEARAKFMGDRKQ